MSLKINENIKKELQEKGILLKDGIPVLLSIYFNYIPDYLPSPLRTKVLSTNIVNVDYVTDTYSWNIPLFEGQEDGFAWIEEYMDMFKAVNKDRRGLKSSVIKRMKKMFMTYPDIRKDEVMKVTQEYINSVENPTYLISSHKFISNEQGEPLKDYIDEFRKSNRELKSGNPNPFKKIV